MPTRNAEGITALVTLLAPGTQAMITPHWPQKITLAQPASLSVSHPVSLSQGTPLGSSGYDANSQLHLALLGSDEQVLGGELLDTRALVIKPGEGAQLSVPLDKDARFVSVVALFRNPDTQMNTWRLILTRDDLDPERARIIELGDNRLTLRVLSRE